MNRKVKIDLLGGYDSLEDCRAKLLAVIDADHFPSESLLNHAIEVRKKEIRWRWLFIPFVLFGFLIVFLLWGALGFHVGKYVNLSLFLIVSLTIVYRVTFYESYLFIYKQLLKAASSLKGEIEGPLKPNIPHKPFFEKTSKSGLQGLLCLQEEAPSEKKGFGKELDLFFAKAGDEAIKGRIKIVLLDQLLRYECKQPCIFNELSSNIARLVDIQGCRAKNVASQMQNYNSRNSIKFKTQNSKTTHLKYLVNLQEYYSQMSDSMLEKQAEALYYFIDQIEAGEKTEKTGKTHP